MSVIFWFSQSVGILEERFADSVGSQNVDVAKDSDHRANAK
jgi:hypothetical protein